MLVPASFQEGKLRETFGKYLTPVEVPYLDEWSDKYRILPRKASSEPGQYRTSRFPFLREIMRCLSIQDHCKEVAVLKGSQLGFTDVAINRILMNIHLNPVSHLYVQKTLGDILKFSKQRLAPSIDLIPEIKAMFGTSAGRDASNTMFLKSYPGGILILGGAQSASSLRSMPIGFLDIDEWDSYELDVQEEGDPCELAIRRTANFKRRKIFYLSTPKLLETSKITPKFMDGDRRFYNIKCPDCGHLAPIVWSKNWNKNNDKSWLETLDLSKCFYIHYVDDDPKTTGLVCPKCHIIHDETKKNIMLAEKNGARWIATNPEGTFPSFCISALYSPIFQWSECVDLWLKAVKNFDEELLKVFINTVLGEPYAVASEIAKNTQLAKRKEDYGADVPNEALIISCGADVQKNRIECEVVAWGREQENWSVGYKVFLGDTLAKDVWMQFDNFLQKIYTRPDGKKMNLAITMIDGRYRRKQVFAFCKPREHRMIFPIRGDTGWGKGTHKIPKRKHELGCWNFVSYVDEVKLINMHFFKVSKPGPRYCHFPDKEEYNDEYFDMLTAEKLTSKLIRGYKLLKWSLPKGKRNEALDCRNYAYTGMLVLDPDFDMIATKGQVLNSPFKRAKKKKRGMVSKGVR